MTHEQSPQKRDVFAEEVYRFLNQHPAPNPIEFALHFYRKGREAVMLEAGIPNPVFLDDVFRQFKETLLEVVNASKDKK